MGNKRAPPRGSKDRKGRKSVVFSLDGEVALGMIAHGADFGGLLADHDVAAVAALPDHVAVAGEDHTGLHIAQQLAVSLLVSLLDPADHAELGGDLREAFGVGFVSHAGVHIGPLGVLALGGMEQVGGMQLSAAFGLGAEFALTQHLGLYIDPSLRYYFDCDQPKSIRTAQPLTFGMEAGLRFKL